MDHSAFSVVFVIAFIQELLGFLCMTLFFRGFNI